MIPCILSTMYAFNIRLGNNPKPCIRDRTEQNPQTKLEQKMQNKSENKSENKSDMYRINEYFETCFDKHHKHIETDRCDFLREDFDDTIECLILEF